MFSATTFKAIAFTAVLMLALVGESVGQIILTREDYIAQYESPRILVTRELVNPDRKALKAISEISGDNVQWDFKAFATAVVDSSVNLRIDLSSDELDLTTFASANHALKSYAAAEGEVAGVNYRYFQVTDNEVKALGFVERKDSNPGIPGLETSSTVYPEPRLIGVLPLDVESTWSTSYNTGYAEHTFTSEVDGWGALLLNAQTQESALRIVTREEKVMNDGALIPDSVIYWVTFATRSGNGASIKLNGRKEALSAMIVYANSGGSTGSDDLEEHASFSLAPNYPNPFSLQTTIPFVLDKPSTVQLAIFNVLGQQVDMIVDADLPAGPHQYVWYSSGETSGLYIARLMVNGRLVSSRSLLLAN